jgi:uncharacterized protein (DUF486 family)
MDRRRTGELGDCSGGIFVHVPANRIGFSAMSLAQLKVMQEVITLCAFVSLAVL